MLHMVCPKQHLRKPPRIYEEEDLTQSSWNSDCSWSSCKTNGHQLDIMTAMRLERCFELIPNLDCYPMVSGMMIKLGIKHWNWEFAIHCEFIDTCNQSTCNAQSFFLNNRPGEANEPQLCCTIPFWSISFTWLSISFLSFFLTAVYSNIVTAHNRNSWTPSSNGMAWSWSLSEGSPLGSTNTQVNSAKTVNGDWPYWLAVHCSFHW